MATIKKLCFYFYDAHVFHPLSVSFSCTRQREFGASRKQLTMLASVASWSNEEIIRFIDFHNEPVIMEPKTRAT